MVLGLLTLAAIPTTIGIAEGISSSSKKDDDEEDPTVASTSEAQRMRKFRLECYCDAGSSHAKGIDGGSVVLHGDKLWIQPKDPEQQAHPFIGFYVPYPDPARHPPPLGLVSFISTDPPMLNWIYVDTQSRELRYGNRTTSIAHTVGPWAWDMGEEEEDEQEEGEGQDRGGGLTLNGGEGAVAVETDHGWQLLWEDEQGKVDRGGKRILQISLERVFVEKGEEAGKGVRDEGKAKDEAGKEKKVEKVRGGVEVMREEGQKKQKRRTETTVEVRTTETTSKDKGNSLGKGRGGNNKTEKTTHYEYGG